jgi:hypothetical protein
LDDAVSGVEAVSHAADDVDIDVTLDLVDDLPEPEGESGTDDDEQGDGDGKRTVENVRRELLRKLDKSNKEMMEQLRSMQATMQEATRQYGVPAKAPSSAQTLDDLSITELEAMRASIPPENKDRFEEYLQERKIDAKVSERLDKYSQTTERKTSEQRFNTTAVDRWPLHRYSSSSFYRVADRILSEMPGSADNPRAVLDAANEAGLELGIAPSTGVQRGGRRSPGTVAPGRATKSGPGGSGAPDLDSMRTIANSLRDAMPGHKFTEEQLKRIAKRQRQYQETLHTRVRG